VKRARAIAIASVAALAVGACAPPPALRLPERGTVLERYDAALSPRERRASGLAADLLLWTRVGGRAQPGVEGRVWIAAPHAARLVVDAAFGVGIDLAAHGDTLEGWVPSRRRAFVFDATDLGAGPAPGGTACRALAALWRPPSRAWDDATAGKDGWTLRWAEDADSLVMTVTPEGRPHRVEWRPARGDTLAVSYESWVALDGEPWPDRLEWTESGSGVSVRARLTRIRRTELQPAQLRAAIPEGATRSTWEELSSWWDELTGAR
jgi:hypothetical protein